MSDEIINKVATSGLITIDLEELYPQGERVELDISTQLIEGLLLKEKDFREFIKTNDWKTYSGKYVAVFCSTEAIVPRWAWMLVASSLQPYAKHVVFGNKERLEEELFQKVINSIDAEQYRDQRINIKGCSHLPVPVSAYVELTSRLRAVAKSIMYGEACSTVPVFKRKD